LPDSWIEKNTRAVFWRSGNTSQWSVFPYSGDPSSRQGLNLKNRKRWVFPVTTCSTAKKARFAIHRQDEKEWRRGIVGRIVKVQYAILSDGGKTKEGNLTRKREFKKGEEGRKSMNTMTSDGSRRGLVRRSYLGGTCFETPLSAKTLRKEASCQSNKLLETKKKGE